ncbi:MAG TPA: ATPase [Elusimicrobia bacterium]|nr:ATPase [Elusimicrobiota bacterium]
MKSMTEKSSINNLIITRVFDVPLDVVWEAWSDQEMFKRWWGPKDFIAPHISIDFRTGGKFVYCMRGAGPDGIVRDFWNTGKYIEILPMEKIVMTMSFADKHGEPVPPAHYDMPGEWPNYITLIVTFESYADTKSKVTVREIGIPDVVSEFACLGWRQSFDKMTQIVLEESNRIASIV